MASIARTFARRGYATASSVKAPLQLNSLTGTYATSAYLAALKKSPKELETLAKEIEAFDQKLKTDNKLAALIQNPTLSASERQAALDKVVPKSQPYLSNLLSVLSENGRLSSAEKVFSDFNSLMSAYRGELEVVVTSAEALDSKTMARLEKALKGSALADGKTLKFTNKVNPSVLGGLLVDIGDKTIDATAATRVNRYNAALAQGV
ncbi:hypothetical protein CspeluHIS016_0105560 [Cutaneotrichosporon spelunceum]|uniref:ATP synthase subunit 5, mitochondrial n=1 Tax=Cutaneotrichosporon spelunceum TaxID=1672016 RepID=A0AAD3TNK3_9TREE|nr:hypothetical protein CspeluHIS016_0105560 [Cutaneotrichosporon spelunceum]